jgi:signal peptidase I
MRSNHDMAKLRDRETARDEGEAKREPGKDFLKDVVFVLVAFFFLNSFVLASFEVPTGSMENEIMAGDFLFVNKFLYGGSTPRTVPFTNTRIPWFRVPGFRDVERGDVIVFEFPGYRDEVRPEEFQFYLKRAIGLAGDTVEIVNRVVRVNGKDAPIPRNIRFDNMRVKEPGAAQPGIFPPGSDFNEDNWGPVVVPARGMTVPLTPESLPRWQTFIAREGHRVQWSAEGTVLLDGKPADAYVVERDYVFGMGDHRDNSLDGRFWGFIPEDNIIGTPMVVYWSWDPGIRFFGDPLGKLLTIRPGRIGNLIR